VGQETKKVVFLTDSLSALQVITSGQPDNAVKELIGSINTLALTTKTVLQWIPAHAGISGNEMADRLAKEGSAKEQPSSHLSYQEAKTLIKNKQKAKFRNKTGGYDPHKDSLHHLSRHLQTLIFRLRTGHCCLNAHLKRIGVKPSALCQCGEAVQTPQHFLQSCPLYQRERLQIWPQYTSLDAKLWGSIDDLHRTAEFTALTGLRI
jgi:hypothetical protein